MTDASVWQIVEAVATAVIALFTVLAALGAIAAAVFAWMAYREGRGFNRTRLLVDLFAQPMTDRFANTVNGLLQGHPTLTVARAVIATRLAILPTLPQAERLMYLDLLGIMGYAAELYAEDVINKGIFLARVSDFIATAFFLLEPAIALGLRSGSLRHNVVVLGRDCVEYRNRIPRTLDDKPELRNYTIRARFPD